MGKSRKIDLYVFRHGETDWNREMRWQGHRDIPLNGTGRQQAFNLIGPLQSLRPTHIISSDLVRALETAKMVATALGCSLTSHAGFRELGFGEAEGLTFEEIGQRFGRDAQNRIRSTQESDLDFSLPGGESKRELLARAFLALEQLLIHGEELAHHEVVGLATHGGVIRTFLQMCGLRDRAQIAIPNGSLFHFEYETFPARLIYRRQVDEVSEDG